MNKVQAALLLASAVALGGCDITASANAPRDSGGAASAPGAVLSGMIGSTQASPATR